MEGVRGDAGGTRDLVERVLMEAVNLARVAGYSRLEVVSAAREAFGDDVHPRPEPEEIPTAMGDCRAALDRMACGRRFAQEEATP